MNNAENINEKYSSKCSYMLEELSDRYFVFAKEYESLFFKDKFVLNIKDANELSQKDIDDIFTKLYDVESRAGYLLLIKKIKDYIKNGSLLLKAKDMQEFVEPIDYTKLINFIKDNIKDFINNLDLPIKFDYKLDFTEDDKKENKKYKNYGIQYFNEEHIENLIDTVLNGLDVFDQVLNTYELLNVQQIEFSTRNYYAIDGAMHSNKNSKLVKINIDEIIKIINENNSNDYNDIFSEGYVPYCASLLEAAYFLCEYMCTNNKEKTKHTFHKNFNGYKENIIDNISLFFDQLLLNGNVDFLKVYTDIYNLSQEYTADNILCKFRNNE